MRKGEPSFIKNMKKFLCLGNIVAFLIKAVDINLNVKESIEPHIFHTYIRI